MAYFKGRAFQAKTRLRMRKWAGVQSGPGKTQSLNSVQILAPAPISFPFSQWSEMLAHANVKCTFT